MSYLPATFPIIAILGPTAVGKTEISLRLAQELNAEIINYDSVQLYKYLNIGSAKPTAEERATVPHHLLGILTPDEPNDVAKFVRRATQIIKQIRMRGKNVILVGGTNMYLESLLNGLTPCPGQHPGIRSTLHFIVKSQGSHFLHEYLQNIDPESAERIHPHDHTRLFRAIEVFAQSGIPISTWHNTWHSKGISHQYEVLKLGLIRSIEELYERINRRVDIMMKTGFVEEVQQLLQMGYSPELNALQALGYRHIIGHLMGNYSLTQCIELMKRDHRHYARRQLIWMRADAKIHWFNPMVLNRQRAIWPYIHTRGTN
ncbi:MAG: tRNA (adenosine(37)-N6)-dimethylallyltransferase MiaA [Dissulfuribacterales bacterium]